MATSTATLSATEQVLGALHEVTVEADQAAARARATFLSTA